MCPWYLTTPCEKSCSWGTLWSEWCSCRWMAAADTHTYKLDLHCFGNTQNVCHILTDFPWCSPVPVGSIICICSSIICVHGRSTLQTFYNTLESRVMKTAWLLLCPSRITANTQLVGALRLLQQWMNTIPHICSSRGTEAKGNTQNEHIYTRITRIEAERSEFPDRSETTHTQTQKNPIVGEAANANVQRMWG